MQGNWENLENSFWWSGGRFPQNLGWERGRPMHPSPNILHPFPQCNREKFKGKMTKKVVRNSENVDIFGGPRTETKFVKWSATRKRLRTAGLKSLKTLQKRIAHCSYASMVCQHKASIQNT